MTIHETTNWAGNLMYHAKEVHSPGSVADLQLLVAHNNRVRALGTRHSFSDLADSHGCLLSVMELPESVDVDSTTASVKVAAGMRYAELARHIEKKGFALPALASLPHISVAGACVTATHGSGVKNGVLAVSVSEFEIVTATGDLISISRDTLKDKFNGVVVNLGYLGIMVNLTLDLVPSFQMRQRVYEQLDLQAATEHFTDLVSCAYSVCLFTDWREDLLTQVWIQQCADEPDPPLLAAPWFTATSATRNLHPVSGMSAMSCTEQLGVPGRWHERLPHFRPEFMPSSGEELQSEYMISRRTAPQALAALNGIRDRIHPVLQICEIRTVAGDEFWMSPCYGQDTVSIHFTWIADSSAVLPVVSLVEETLAEFGARPHWAKIFTTPPEVIRELYPRLADFAELVAQFDPAGKFRNSYFTRHFSS
jgi:xylitol oxidase